MLGLLVAQARTRSGLSQRQLATLAGVPASTVARIESEAVSPTEDTVARLLSAAGFDWDVSLKRRSDPTAIAAARRLLDPAFPKGIGTGDWIQQWSTIGAVRPDGTVRSPSETCRRAGLAASLTARPGAVAWRATPDRSAADAAKRASSTKDRIALTGGVAANRLRPSADAPWLTLYSDNPATFGEQFQWTRSDSGDGAPVLVIPFDPTSRLGVWTDTDGTCWADPWQVIIDCYAGNGRMPDQADLVLSAVTATAS